MIIAFDISPSPTFLYLYFLRGENSLRLHLKFWYKEIIFYFFFFVVFFFFFFPASCVLFSFHVEIECRKGHGHPNLPL